jgi:hypothetical protein
MNASSEGSERAATALARSFSSRSASSRYSSERRRLVDLALLGGDRLEDAGIDLDQRVGDRLLAPARALDQGRELDQLEVAHDGVRDVEIGVEAQLAEPAAHLGDRREKLVAQQPERRLQGLGGPEELLLSRLPIRRGLAQLLGEGRRLLVGAAVGALGVGEDHRLRARVVATLNSRRISSTCADLVSGGSAP